MEDVSVGFNLYIRAAVSLQGLKVFLTDSLCLRYKLHGSPTVHHASADMNVQFNTVLSAYFFEVLQISDHDLSGAIKDIDGWEAGEINKGRTEKISIIACCHALSASAGRPVACNTAAK